MNRVMQDSCEDSGSCSKAEKLDLGMLQRIHKFNQEVFLIMKNFVVRLVRSCYNTKLDRAPVYLLNFLLIFLE
jgi:hypothetical protein